MIQRIQSLWLFLASSTAALIWFLPLFSDDETEKTFFITESLVLLLVLVFSGLISFVTIFFFKKRSAQKQLIILNICLALGIIALEYLQIENFKSNFGIKQGHWQISAILPFFIILFLSFAYRGIRKDEKLLSSTDRLR
jgi:hypothetical protein